MVSKNKPILNFYSISSSFNNVLLKLCNKIVNSEESLYVNFDKPNTKKDVDRFLWISQKNNFLPHKTYGEKISKRDKIILFDGSYKDLKTNGIYEGSFNAKGKFEGEGIFMFFNENNQITMQINGTWKNHLLEGPAKYCNLTKSSNKLDCNQVNFINGKIVK